MAIWNRKASHGSHGKSWCEDAGTTFGVQNPNGGFARILSNASFQMVCSHVADVAASPFGCIGAQGVLALNGQHQRGRELRIKGLQTRLIIGLT